MKKVKTSNLALLVIFVTIFNYSSAQHNIFLGVKGGISIPNLKSSGDNPVSNGWSSRQGPYFGIVGELILDNHWSLQSELNYSSQGGKKNGLQAIPGAEFAAYFPPGQTPPPYLYASYKSEAKLNYIELPILAKLNLPINNSFSFFINGGIYAGYLVSARNLTSGTSNIYLDDKLTMPLLPVALSFDAETDIKDEIKKFNFGIQGGVGFSYSVNSTNKLQITGGGNYGLVHIQKDETNGKNNTGAATITLSYLIKI
ncbi:MAG TPA: porin family protein [Panacibacter sp.]|nr:porin family protein [Panacibacter sp.]